LTSSSKLSSSTADKKTVLIQNEEKTVEMIKKMTREDKILLNQMVQSVLHYQQRVEERDVELISEKRKLVHAKQVLVEQELEMQKVEIKLVKLNNMLVKQ